MGTYIMSHLLCMEVDLVLPVGVGERKSEPYVNHRGNWVLTASWCLKVVLIRHLIQIIIPAQKLIFPPQGPKD